MTTTITGASGAHILVQLDGWEESQESRHIVHQLLGSGDVAITLRPAAPSQGELTAVFETLEEAKALVADMADADTLSLVDTDRADLNMTFVAISSSTATLEDETRELGIATFTYLKVIP